MAAKKIFCSLDIETTGFDPAKDEILEIGFVFFILTKQGIKYVKEFSQVFKPNQEPSPQILALTGISKEELTVAPKFSEYQGFLQEQFNHAVIVGHNIGFDTKFLEGLGIKFSGQTIDTLDLAQFILPTHKAYNLENLMHFFGIAHLEAHRALPDAKATLKVLEGLLVCYSAFSADLREQIEKLIQPFVPGFYDFLQLGLSLQPVPPTKTAEEIKISAKKKPGIFLENNEIYFFSFGAENIMELVSNLNTSKKKVLLVIKSQFLIFKLWKAGLVEPFLGKDEIFNSLNFKKFLSKPNLTWDEAKFALKILVWQATNWQTVSLVDLNLSFFGGQFKEQISGGDFKSNKTSKIWVITLDNFLAIDSQTIFKDRSAVIFGLENFEGAISDSTGYKISWGKFIYLLKSVYNPEINVGQIKFKETIITALLDTDLFFGIVSALLQTNPPSFFNLSLKELQCNEQKFNQLKQAADNFTTKIEKINQKLKISALDDAVINLRNFFSLEIGQVKWVEFSPQKCLLISKPLDVRNLAEKVYDKVKEVCFVNPMMFSESLGYFKNRLGLINFSEKVLKIQSPEQKNNEQMALSFNPKKKINVKLFSQTVNFVELQREVFKKHWPMAIVFQNSKQVKDFYQEHYETLKPLVYLAAQIGGGGTNKLLHNFQIHKHGLLLISSRQLLNHIKNLYSQETIPVKTLILGHLPFEPMGHPYIQAQSQAFANSFLDFALPLAMRNLANLLNFFATDSLEYVFIFDQKLSKDYSKRICDEFGKSEIFQTSIR